MQFKLLSGAAAMVLFAVGAPASQAQDAHDRPAIQLAGDGIQLRDMESGQVDTVGFGISQDDTVQFISKALGDPEKSDVNSDCDAGALGEVDFQGPLHLFFKAGEFVGWSVNDGAGFSSANDIQIGMLYSDLNRAAQGVEGEETSLGFEFTADQFHGLMTEGGPNGKITDIWAGTICSMR